MNFSIFFVLAVALFGVLTNAYSGVGYDGLYGSGYGNGGPTAVCDTCQCVKTVVRPLIQQIPYTCSRRIRAPPRYRSAPIIAGPAVSMYSAPGYIESGPAYIESRPAFIETRTGYVGSGGAGRYGGYGTDIVA